MCRLRPARLDHFLEIRNRLEVVGVKLPGVKREFGLDVVVEFHHLELHAFLFKRGLDEVDDVGVRHGRDADAKRRVGERARRDARKRKGGCERDGCEKTREIHGCSPDVGCVLKFLGLSDGDLVRPFRRNIRAARAAEDAAALPKRIRGTALERIALALHPSGSFESEPGPAGRFRSALSQKAVNEL